MQSLNLKKYLSEETADWLCRFQERTGRMPRVLQIGNIANNAFANAKLLREMGLEADVVCPDYYHTMGCPEWEDAEFDSSLIDDDNFPAWHLLDLGGYQRPKWFVQGPLDTCLRYLEAKNEGRESECRGLWRELALSNGTMTPEPATPPQEAVRKTGNRGSISWFKRKLAVWCWTLVSDRLLWLGGVLLLLPWLHSLLGGWSELSWLLGGVLVLGRFAVYAVATARRILFKDAALAAEESEPPSPELVMAESHRHLKELGAEFQRCHAGHADRFRVDDYLGHLSFLPAWKHVLGHYDVVIGCAVEAVWPMLCGVPCIAYSHGTVRDIPFEDSVIGRIAFVVYAMASCVMITNADCMEAARTICHEEEPPLVFGYHGFDERRTLAVLSREKDWDFTAFCQTNKIPERPFYFFAPSRQHWETGSATLRKGNDVYLRALKRVQETHPDQFVVILVAWGAELEKSKQLVAELGLESVCCWIPPVKKATLLRLYESCDAVIDQFVLPCVGGVGMDVLLLGKSLLVTKIDQKLMAKFYGEPVPTLAGNDADDVASALLQVIEQSPDVQRSIDACREWVDTHHTHRNVMIKLLEAFARVVDLSSL